MPILEQNEFWLKLANAVDEKKYGKNQVQFPG